jgi:hypothetical protein
VPCGTNFEGAQTYTADRQTDRQTTGIIILKRRIILPDSFVVLLKCCVLSSGNEYMSSCRIRHTCLPMKMEQSVSKRRHIKFRRWGITQKKAYNIQNTAKISNQEYFSCVHLASK